SHQQSLPFGCLDLPTPNPSSKNKGTIATMRFTITSIALFVALTVAMPYGLRTRRRLPFLYLAMPLLFLR
ncbi:MAG: hypothetical protein Q9224_004959, partial [Gallowayella concinna]